MPIYAIKGSDNPTDTERVYTSLLEGEGRFGWSNVETADLNRLRARIEAGGWDSLTEVEQDCYHEFLLKLREDDYVVYVNVPEWGECTLARVAGPYQWRWEGDDFNHRFPVDGASVQSFGRNSEVVPALLSARLKLRGRWWQVYAEEEFEELLSRLPEADGAVARSWRTNLRELSTKVRPLFLKIAEQIQSTHPRKDLEGLMEQLFRRVPGVRNVERLQGGADYGADLLVDFEFVPIPGLVQTQTLAVQVKSFSGKHEDAGAVRDLHRAFEHYDARGQAIDMGLVVSTASEPGNRLIQAADKLSEQSGKPVSILVGADLVEFFLRHGTGLLHNDG